MSSDVLRAAAVVFVVAVLVLAATQLDSSPGHASVRAESPTGAVGLTESVNGDAVLRAGGLKPGASTTGTVTVANSGDATGLFKLQQTDVLDTPGAGGGRLSKALRLDLDEPESGRPIYSGVLGGVRPETLGYLSAGQKVTYRFKLTLPRSADAGPLAGSRVETTFDWSAATAEPPGPGNDHSPPVVLAQTPPRQALRGRTVLLALTCSERCRVVGLSRDARAVDPVELRPGRPALQPIELSAADARVLGQGVDAALPLGVTVADPAGNRTTVPVTIRLSSVG